MLTFEHPTELQEQYQKGLAASTLVNQPFWKLVVEYMNDQVREALEALDDVRHADDRLKANAVNRWLLTKDLVARIEQFPLAAIEAARELGEMNER